MIGTTAHFCEVWNSAAILRVHLDCDQDEVYTVFRGRLCAVYALWSNIGVVQRS